MSDESVRKIDDGGPAFPRAPVFDATKANRFKDGEWVGGSDGMSIRDWFAGQALGLLSQPLLNAMHSTRVVPNSEQIANLCYQVADAMLAARKTGGGA